MGEGWKDRFKSPYIVRTFVDELIRFKFRIKKIMYQLQSAKNHSLKQL